MMTGQMKPSGIAWIGDIPKEWNIIKIRFTTELRNEQAQYTQQDKFIGLENINSYTGQYLPSESKYDEGTYDVYRKGDVLFSKLRPYLAKAMIATDDGFCTGELAVIKNYSGDRRFLLYYLLSDGFIKMVDASTYGTKMPRASWDYIKNLQIPVISYTEQKTIADYLVTQCAKIDSIAADMEKQIELLQKHKKSLITETVTKGLNRSVQMKNSGIKWIGEIPYHWGTKRLRYAAAVKTGPFGTQLGADEYVDEGIPIINVKNIGYGSILAEDLDCVPQTVAERLSIHRLETEDIVFGRKGAVDKHAIISDENVGWVQGSDCIRVRSNHEIHAGYLNYLFDSTYFSSYVMLYANGATMPSMSSDILLNSQILVPPLDEQKAIAAYLDEQCDKIESILAGKQDQLDLLQKHKKSLIYEYVTGKKRVKGAM